MYKIIFINLVFLYGLYQSAVSETMCPHNSIEINICGEGDYPATRLLFNVSKVGHICLASESSHCHLEHLQRTEQRIKSTNLRQILLNQVDVKKEEESSTKCLESPTYTLYSNTNCSGDHFVSSIDISGLTRTIHYLQWTSLIFIYDKFSEERVSSLQLELSVIGIKSGFIKYENIYCEDIVHKLHEFYMLRRKDDSNFNIVLICSRECTSNVLRAANGFDDVYGRRTAFYHHSNWLIASPLISRCELEDIPLLMDNVALFKEFSYSTIEHDPLQRLMNEIMYVMKIFGRDCQEKDPCHSKTQEENRLLILEYLHGYLSNMKDQKQISISTLAWGPNRRRELRNIGFISKDGLVDMEDDIFPNRKYGLNNKTIVVSTNPWAPFVMKTMINHTAEYSGFCMEILKELANDLNFSYILREPDDKEWGRIKDGQWTGLIGDLARETVDMVVAPISISPDREDVMDFTTPFFYEKSGIGLKMPDPNSTKWKRLLQPLSWQVLLCLTISFMSVSMILTVMERTNPYYQTVGSNKRYLSTQVQAKICYLWGALLSHGGHPVTKSTSGKILIGCWWIFCIIMAATYSGNLIAFLTVNKDKPPISSLNDMIENNDYKWGILGGTVYMTLFQNSKREDYRKIWDGIVEYNKTDPRVLSLSSDDHLDLVLEGQYAFLGEYTPMELWQKDHCDIVTINENFFPMLFGLGLPNNSAFTLIFTERLMKIYESGLLRVWKEQWWPKPNSTRCSVSSYTQVKAVDLLSLQSAFYVIAIGLFLSLLMLTIENLANPKRSGLSSCLPCIGKEDRSSIECKRKSFSRTSTCETLASSN